MVNLPPWAAEFGKLARGIWKNLPRKTVVLNIVISFIFEKFSTSTTSKMFDIWANDGSIFLWHRNVLDIHRKHSFMATQMLLKVTTLGEFLLTNVTREPSAFIVWLQQMCLELVTSCKTFWTVTTWVRLCTSLNTNMLRQTKNTFKQLPTVMTVIKSSVVVYTLMWLQMAGFNKTFITQWTLVWTVSCVDSHVSV